MTDPSRKLWPPDCEMPECHEPRVPNAIRPVDFGAAGLRSVALCESHLARLSDASRA